MEPIHDNRNDRDDRLNDQRLVSLQTLARLTDAHATTVRRWLREAEIQPVVVGRGRAGAIRYRWREVASWLETLQAAD